VKLGFFQENIEHWQPVGAYIKIQVRSEYPMLLGKLKGLELK
jgi:hypothetical protein